jgi:hypothetical protein
MVQVVLDAYQKHGEAMYKRAIVSSFYPGLIYQVNYHETLAKSFVPEYFNDIH